MQLTGTLPVYLPDSRAVEISSYGLGNTKIGPNVYTFSRIAGARTDDNPMGTCPGATRECESICYAKRIGGIVKTIYHTNSIGPRVPPIPDDCQILRVHISGDFDSVDYIENWVQRMQQRPDVTMWAYTRSWRVPSLLPALEVLRALPNVQLFASMDVSTVEVPPTGWRRAWIEGDSRECEGGSIGDFNNLTFDGTTTYICPEQVGRRQTCQECRYCFSGQTRDVTFLRH